jgi:hypothetical protein
VPRPSQAVAVNERFLEVPVVAVAVIDDGVEEHHVERVGDIELPRSIAGVIEVEYANAPLSLPETLTAEVAVYELKRSVARLESDHCESWNKRNLVLGKALAGVAE